MLGHNCPHCGKVLHSVNVQPMIGREAITFEWACIAMCCPSCEKVTSVQTDPRVTVDQVVRQLKRSG